METLKDKDCLTVASCLIVKQSSISLSFFVKQPTMTLKAKGFNNLQKGGLLLSFSNGIRCNLPKCFSKLLLQIQGARLCSANKANLLSMNKRASYFAK